MGTFPAAKTIYEMKSGRVSNLSLQKLLYLSHMVHLGEHGEALASNAFQAWDYGPVEPQLYHKLKAYGAGQVPDVFPCAAYSENDPEYASIETVMQQLKNTDSGKLVAITHWENGAWASNYLPGARGVIIPNADILKEFHERQRLKDAA